MRTGGEKSEDPRLPSCPYAAAAPLSSATIEQSANANTDTSYPQRRMGSRQAECRTDGRAGAMIGSVRVAGVGARSVLARSRVPSTATLSYSFIHSPIPNN